MFPIERLKGQDGIAMPLVLAVSGVLVLLVAGLTSTIVAEANRISLQRQRELSLQLAETATEDVAAQLTDNPSYTTGELLPAFASAGEERAWVIDAAAAKPPVQTGSAGEWVAVKPTGSNVIYGVGYSPTKAAPKAVRIVRVEYDFGPVVPPAALMSNGHIELAGNPTVSGRYGNVHSNGDVTGSGSPSASGFISASGTYSPTGTVTTGNTANTGGGRPRRYIPRIDPRHHYPYSEYDLCPDGTVRAGPSYPGPEGPNLGAPCAGTTLASGGTNRYRGWRYAGQDGSLGAVWSYTGSTGYDGVYYVYQGSAQLHGSPGSSSQPWLVTVLAESMASGAEPHCPHTGGDIQIQGSPTMLYHPKAQPVLMLAGRDLVMLGGGSAGDGAFHGLMAAHEQVRLGGDSSITGAVLVEDSCDTDGSPQSGDTVVSGNPDIRYDEALEVTFGNDIRLTIWLEL